MARTKTTPVKSAQKQKKERASSRKREKSSVAGTADLQSPASKASSRVSSSSSRRRSTRKNTSHGKGKKLVNNNDNLPPELRQAGLIAHQGMSQGKCFGPFRGEIIKKKRPPSEMHSLICDVGSVDGCTYHFYAHKDHQDQCKWLQQMQTAPNPEQQNIVAHNSAAGVSYEVARDIKQGEELLVLFNDSYGGKKYPAYIENMPVQFVPQPELLTVVPLEYKKQLGVTTSDKSPMQEASGETLSDGTCGEEDTTADDDDAGDDNGYIDSDGDENDEYDEGCEGDDDVQEDDDVEEGDDADASESDGEEDTDQAEEPEWTNKSSKATGKKKTNTSKKTIKNAKEPKKRRNALTVLEIKSTNEMTKTESVVFKCSYCAIESSDKEVAEKHVSSGDCLSLEFSCPTCGRTFQSKHTQVKHVCAGKPKCSVCDKEFHDWNALMTHIRNQKNNPEHKNSCKECNVEFADKREKRRHVRVSHPPPQGELKCHICEKVYSNKHYLRDHIKTHNPDGFKCPECGKNFSSGSNLRKHVRKHKPGYKPYKDKRVHLPRERKHECMECQKLFDSPNALEVHFRTHTGERPYLCEKCEWKFSQKGHLERHMRTVHRPLTSEEGSESQRRIPPAEQPQTCDICKKVYASARVLKVHVQTVHEGERPHKCKYCEATFTQRGHLWRHKHTVHPDCEEVQQKIMSGEHVCSVEGCGLRFPCGSDLTVHMSSKHNTTWPFACEQCGVTFANRSNLSKHIRRRHSDPNVDQNTCGTCYQTFENTLELMQHRRSHTGDKGFQCELCGQGFVQRSGLNKHLRCRRCPNIEGSAVKIALRKYECNVCNRMFPGPSDLKAHRRTHTGEKPFECPVCHKAFSQTGNLSKHVRYVHEKQQRPKEKPRDKKYFCSLCGKAFLCPSSLSMHCRTHSGDKPYACEQCDACFAQAGNLKKHLNRWHNPDNPVKRGTRKRGRKRNSVDKQESGKLQKETGFNLETADQSQGAALASEDDESYSGDENQTKTNESREQHGDPDVAVTSSLQPYTGNPRACTPLNSVNQGHVTPLNTALASIACSTTFQRNPIIMSHFVNTTTVPLTQAVPSVHVTQGVLQPQQVEVSCPPGTVPSSSVVLPHMHTIFSQQMSNAPFVPPAILMGQGTQPDMTIFPFSPSALFQQ
ncbi:zinc finger protein 420 [Nematostella vectensis]|nr:zinc finger protein 420 [Nematostella vectensis]